MRAFVVVVAGFLAGMLVVALVLTLDARRILLDTDSWTEATAQVLEDDSARRALAAVVTDGTVGRVTCGSAIAAFAARTDVGRRAIGRVELEVNELLATQRALSLWRDANRGAHGAFVTAARTNRGLGNDRLLELRSMLDRAADVTEVAQVLLRDDADEAAREDGCGGSGGERLELLDPGAMRAAADAASALHTARWLPALLGGGILACVLVLVAVAGSVRRLGLGLGVGGLAGILAAYVARELLTGDLDALVDGIRDPGVRELARATISAALRTTIDHLEWVMAGSAMVVAISLVLVLAGRRTTRT